MALWAIVVAYAAVTGLPVGVRVLAFGAYLLVPALLLAGPAAPPGRVPVRELGAALLLWLPIELHLLPALPVPGVRDLGRFAGLADAVWLLVVVRRLPGIGVALRWRDVGLAVAAFLAFSAVALPVGLATRFIAWHPRSNVTTVLVRPLLIYLLIALPEEFLFRGLIQNLLTRWLGLTRALPIAAVVFGLAHLPDPRYVVLATIAGVAYGLVYARTERITASAVTHALVDATWVLLLDG
jgi:membrane protease YdiL (CAAX protease family)